MRATIIYSLVARGQTNGSPPFVSQMMGGSLACDNAEGDTTTGYSAPAGSTSDTFVYAAYQLPAGARTSKFTAAIGSSGNIFLYARISTSSGGWDSVYFQDTSAHPAGLVSVTADASQPQTQNWANDPKLYDQYCFSARVLPGGGQSVTDFRLYDAGGVMIDPPLPPSTPTGLTATAGQMQVALAWDAQMAATFVILRDGAAVDTASTNAYTDYNVGAGETHSYQIEATSLNGTSAPCAAVSATLAAATPPAVPAYPNLWAAGVNPAANMYATAPNLVDGATDDTTTGYAGT